jgi:inorganic pyrophosphatase
MQDKLFEVQIEIAHGDGRIKYETNQGKLIVDRFTKSMPYPANYGSILHTLGGDGDPLDVFLITPVPLQPGCFINVRIIGSIMSQDEKGEDLKVIALPSKSMTDIYNDINSLEDLSNTQWGKSFMEHLEYFLKRYKDLEKNRQVTSVGPWYSQRETLVLIDLSIV